MTASWLVEELKATAWLISSGGTKVASRACWAGGPKALAAPIISTRA